MARSEIFAKVKRRPLIFVLALVSITLIVVDQASGSGPVNFARGVARDSFGAVGDNIASIIPASDSRQVKSLKKENADLKSQLAQAQSRADQSNDVRQERDQLLALFRISTIADSPKVVARVTAIDNSDFVSTIEIGKGSDDGIAVNMPVVDERGLIGRVVRTSGTRSVVLLITDTTSNVGVRLGSANEVGIGVGQGSGKNLRVDLIELNTSIKVGDIAVTNGEQHSLFPPGIPVGKVVESSVGPQALRRNVSVEPLSKSNQFRDVAVIQWRGQ